MPSGFWSWEWWTGIFDDVDHGAGFWDGFETDASLHINTKSEWLPAEKTKIKIDIPSSKLYEKTTWKNILSPKRRYMCAYMGVS